ncbi:conserved hypothetical protein [Uncinocarpus reesii 1704]|uniref:Cytochrome P450 n=1 Tax=Uncinocarpus reesii (strain UAMH 1704) TaxID=336963 RepID=C4JFM9_UNCRE|nr:uncharacterized protein UREG_02363 [Uncinocarpus reesii 1704]EEP77514.1 conserved hypothetical protein [Uncinocarpus reesii 1704]
MALLTDLGQFVAQHPYVVLCLLLVSFFSGRSIYRLYFHPLAKFPGPKLAAVTLWYEYYYDGIKGGQYTFEILRMHEKYGSLEWVKQIPESHSLFGTSDHDHHRLRRSALRRFFSKASITQLEPLIAKKIRDMCAIIETHAGTGKPVAISEAFSCLSSDIATEYAFGRSTNFISPDNPKFEKNFRRTIETGSMVATHSKQFPWIRPLSKMIPIAQGVGEQVKALMDRTASGKEEGGNTIFHELLSGQLPPQEKTFKRLEEEGQLIVGAGTETVGWGTSCPTQQSYMSLNHIAALSVTIFYLLSQPETFAKLRGELEEAIPDPSILPPVTVLENLPYLISTPIPPVAVIAEGLRLSYGVVSRSQRISPHEPLIFKPGPNYQKGCTEYVIPPGQPVGMSCYITHHDPELFPDSRNFKPERWLDNEGKRHRHLDPYLMSFSKGSRQCIGINLAYAELYLVMSAVIRIFGDRFKLFETTLKEVEAKSDYFLPIPESEKGIRVLVRAK